MSPDPLLTGGGRGTRLHETLLTCARHVLDMCKTCARRVQDMCKTCARRVQDVC